MTVGGRLMIGALAAAVVAFASFRARALTRTGAGAAAIIGTVAVAAGWDWAALLIAYFASTSLMSRIGARRKHARLVGFVAKTGARDATQVMANGFPFLICAVLAILTPSGNVFVWAAAGAASLAASAADTWATEIGTLVGKVPRSILTFRRMSVGESGGVTLAGWLAVLGGASLIGIIAAMLMGLKISECVFIVLGGIVGACVDSIVGASLQRRSWCDACGRATEMRIHICGTRTRHVGGLAWLENDGVNLVATATGALASWGLITWLLNPWPG
jgi:uncharacterized protein (TIGR00297 family)